MAFKVIAVSKRLKKCLLALICLSALTFVVIGFAWVNLETEEAQTEKPQLVNPLNGMTIGIDPGHGGYDPGFFTDDLRECDIVLDIGLKLRRLLEQSGAEVVMTREEDADLWDYKERDEVRRHDLDNRIQLLGDYEVELLVSLHANSFPSQASRGAQTFFHPRVSDSKLLADCIQEQLIQVLGNTDRPILPGDFYMIRELACPGALVEVGFLSNPTERDLLTNPKYQERVAWAIYLGILDYLVMDDTSEE